MDSLPPVHQQDGKNRKIFAHFGPLKIFSGEQNMYPDTYILVITLDTLENNIVMLLVTH